MTMPAMPRAGFAMVKPKIVLGAHKAFLNGPAQARCSRQVLERGSFARIGEVKGQIVGIFEVAAEEQPALEAVLRRPV